LDGDAEAWRCAFLGMPNSDQSSLQVCRKKGCNVPYALAVDLGGTKCSAAVIDRKGRIVSRRTVPVDLGSPSGPVFQILQLAKSLVGVKKPHDAYVAAAVAVPGLVRPNGTVWAPNLPGWKQMPLARR